MTHKIFNKRASGVLLHITSLPSSYGIGDLGPEAYRFVDFLAETHQRYWQILPLNPTDSAFGNSPYSSASAFAGNPFLISPQLVMKEGWLKISDLEPLPDFSSQRTDYRAVGVYKQNLLDCAFQQFKASHGHSHALEEFAQFCLENQFWLDDYALFVVFKKQFQGKMWSQWPAEFCGRKPAALSKIKEKFSDELAQVKFSQYVFFKQWSSLKSYAKSRCVRFIGDIPIYVNYDGADVWAQPQLFKLDDQNQPLYVAGVPPDYFSVTGQRWGNPVYDWGRLKETQYTWWIDRIRHNLKLFDFARIDHFRGFIAYWEIPAEEETAINGQWMDVPYENFFTTLLEKFHELPLIAEDLGVITPDVTSAMNHFGFPGMKVLLFAFGGDPLENPYMPDNHIKDCVLYTGTHDNNTVRGWFDQDRSEEEKKNLLNYFKKAVSADEISWLFVQTAMESVANTVIIPIQDFLGLGKEARMNIPGKVNGNWQWRLKANCMTSDFKRGLLKLTKSCQRSL